MKKIQFFQCKVLNLTDNDPQQLLNKFILENPGIDIIDIKFMGMLPSQTANPRDSLLIYTLVYQEPSNKIEKSNKKSNKIEKAVK